MEIYYVFSTSRLNEVISQFQAKTEAIDDLFFVGSVFPNYNSALKFAEEIDNIKAKTGEESYEVKITKDITYNRFLYNQLKIQTYTLQNKK